MPNIGFNELLVILLLAVLLFGGAKLPGLGKSLGEGIKNFKKGLKGEDDEPKSQANAVPPPAAHYPQHAQVAHAQHNQALGPSGPARGKQQEDVVDVDHRDVNR